MYAVMRPNVRNAPPQASRILAQGHGWRAADVICQAGPADRPFEEQHGRYSIAAVLDGTFTYRSMHGRTLLTPGSLLLGNADACFQCGHDHGVGDRCIAFQLDTDLFEDVVRSVPGARHLAFPIHRLPLTNEMLPLVERISAAAARPDTMEFEELALLLAAHAVKETRASPAGDYPLSAREERRAAESVRFLEEHYPDEISIEALAARAGVSRFHFLRQFRQAVGVTPYRFLIRTRLRAAARQLRSTPARVTDVAFACGFNDLSEFTRRFRGTFGVAPGAYARAFGGRSNRH
jgi:AraC family transcriptional regulator